MIDDLMKDAAQRMEKSVSSLTQVLTKIRTGRAHPSLLEQISEAFTFAHSSSDSRARSGRTARTSPPRISTTARTAGLARAASLASCARCAGDFF